MDASKAFDLIDHSLLLERLLKRDVPTCVVQFLLAWYQSQRLRVSGMGSNLAFFLSLGESVGGVLSLLLFVLTVCFRNWLSLGLAVTGTICLVAPLLMRMMLHYWHPVHQLLGAL